MFVKTGVITPALVLSILGRSSIIAGTQAVVATFFPRQHLGTLIGFMWTIAGMITCVQYALVKLTTDVNESWKAWVIVLALVVLMSCHWIYLRIIYIKNVSEPQPPKSEAPKNINN
ncbi:unnamed protein product [Rotaria magnacalcarata]|uniref:Uncharacterized protein n=1 Tax=Rotaria magnacalcarata TaxID=392030 RepID=A0A816U2I3_9BILA|nr:unnamed protein product [Rotaria magnacalcarata]CAF2119232.1 unnamed protein product [Rotaria magnacalcarata]CAF3998431.1 unnamed protein product [Rotaria magnacalcarata]CAF4102838.1 unnamed protein product [Rotaria magnacalcarata]